MKIEPIKSDRRFSGVLRLYQNPESLNLLREAHVAVIGLGGVGSWTAEALARSGIGKLTLVDLDHVSESNINRQVHALDYSIGQSKVKAMSERILQINPGCQVFSIEDFISLDNISYLLSANYQIIIDCTDQIFAKAAIILYAKQRNISLILCGGVGGKTNPFALKENDLSDVKNDPLLAKLRRLLRSKFGFPKNNNKKKIAIPKMGIRVLWIDQNPILPKILENKTQESFSKISNLQGLSCSGYGSVVTVTATMGLAAANSVLQKIL
ncbi:MAG: tRNA threonylcarbamoyladenosine dehydratase [Bordetella sp.]|nr:MAG: tRNA threonylcarbamoyladenosine dehydratase [Bordetella sp.]